MKYFNCICIWLRWAIQIACASLALLVATQTDSAAHTLLDTSYAITSGATSAINPPAANDAPATLISMEPLVINAELENTDFADTGTISSSTKTEPANSSQITPPTLEESKIDWNGVIRDTSIVFAGQVGAVAVLYFMPESVSSWTPDQKNAGWAKYKRNFVDPVLDKDDFYINYVMHPYFGATYYIRGRERGLSQTYALAYSAFLSAMYEFGTECIAERPSIQDLIITPVAGSLLGAYIFEPLRESIKNKAELHWYDHAVLVLTDSLGVLSLGIEKLFGIKSTIMVNVPVPQLQNGSTTTAGNYFSVKMQFPL